LIIGKIELIDLYIETVKANWLCFCSIFDIKNRKQTNWITKM